MGGAPQEQPEGRCAPSPLQAWRGQFCEHLLFSGLPIQDTAWPSCLGHSPGVHYCLNLQVENRGSGGNRLHLEPQAAAPTTLGWDPDSNPSHGHSQERGHADELWAGRAAAGGLGDQVRLSQSCAISSGGRGSARKEAGKGPQG